MAKHGCVKIELDDSKYSSPVPVIGLYIAAASLVCFLAMLYDILSGFRHRKRWLPCQLFSLNSVTLTLLSIAAKLPVDLTTTMPSAQDQLSKLTGTTLVCICMGFLMPSLGKNQNSENLTNMAALAIMVVTIIANICIQIRTGVIFMFIIEHIIIMSCMLVLFMLLCSSARTNASQKNVYLDLNKDLFTKGQGSMLKRMRLAYLYGYSCNPQFMLCKQHNCQLVGLVCITSLGVLVQAAFRSSSLEFCRGISDYDWSMWILVATQISTIILGGFAISFRTFAMFNQTRNHNYAKDEAEEVNGASLHQVMYHTTWDIFISLPELLMMFVLLLITTFVYFPLSFVYVYFELLFENIYKDFKSEDSGDIHESVHEYVDLIWEEDCRLNKWSLQKGVKEMKRCTGTGKSESVSHLPQLLLENLPSQDLHSLEPYQENCEVSSLSLVLVVRIAQVSLPSKLSGTLLQAYSEAHEICQFIDKRLRPKNLRNRHRTRLAQGVWAGNGFGPLLPEICKRATASVPLPSSQSELNYALMIIKGLKSALPPSLVWDEVGIITTFISGREYSSIEDLYGFIKQLFVDMMHILLTRLPHAVFKDAIESPAEVFDQRVGLALKLVCKLISLEAQIQWSFPVGCNITSMFHDPHSQIDTLEDPADVDPSNPYAAVNETLRTICANSDVRFQIR